MPVTEPVDKAPPMRAESQKERIERVKYGWLDTGHTLSELLLLIHPLDLADMVHNLTLITDHEQKEVQVALPGTGEYMGLSFQSNTYLPRGCEIILPRIALTPLGQHGVFYVPEPVYL